MSARTVVQTTLKAVAGAFILFCTYLMIRLSYPYFSFDPFIDFLITKQNVYHLDYWRYAFYIHVGTSTFTLLNGCMQFSRYLILRHSRIHRLIGKLYVVFVLCLSGPSGFILAIHANGGWIAKTSFTLLSLLWIAFTYLAYSMIRRRDIDAHRAFMIRSYALTLAAITLRSYVFFIGKFVHMHGPEAYQLVSWLSWVPNLIAAEILIRSGFMKMDLEPAIGD